MIVAREFEGHLVARDAVVKRALAGHREGAFDWSLFSRRLPLKHPRLLDHEHACGTGYDQIAVAIDRGLVAAFNREFQLRSIRTRRRDEVILQRIRGAVVHQIDSGIYVLLPDPSEDRHVAIELRPIYSDEIVDAPGQRIEGFEPRMLVGAQQPNAHGGLEQLVLRSILS